MEQTEPQAGPAPKRIDWSKLVTTVLVGLLAGVLVYQGVNEARRAALVKDGQSAPAVVGRRLGGGAFDFSELRGKAVVLDFFATWCAPCREEMPMLVALAREYRDRGLVLVVADQASADQAAAVAIMMERVAPDHPDNLHVVLAAEETLDSYRVEALPTTYLISRDGRVLDAFRGAARESSLRSAIERALQQ